MRKSQHVNPNPTDSIIGKELIVEKLNDESTDGNWITKLDQMVQHGHEPLQPTFGLLRSRVYNERNANKSRREDVYVYAYDLWPLIEYEKSGLNELGNDEVERMTELVDVTTPGSIAFETGHLVISDKVKCIDRVHGKRERVTVDEWKPRLIRIYKSGDAGGRDLLITKQVVRESDPLPTITANTVMLKREQIGDDKYLQTLGVAPDGQGTLTVIDAFGQESCETTTTVEIKPLSFTMPARTLDVIGQKLEQIDGINQRYTVTRLTNGWPTLVSYEEEPITGKRVKVTRTVHDSQPTFNVDGTARFVSNVKHSGCGRWIKVVREIHETILTQTFYEYHSVEYGFPAYLSPANPFLIFRIGEGHELINPVKSSAHRFKIPCRFEITYHASPPNASEVFQFKPVSIEVQLPQQKIHEPSIITDSVTISTEILNETYRYAMSYLLGLGGGIPGYALQTVNFTFQASSPTATEYINLMKGLPVVGWTPPYEVLILEDSSRWKFNLWRRVRVYMRFPDLTQSLSGSLIYY